VISMRMVLGMKLLRVSDSVSFGKKGRNRFNFEFPHETNTEVAATLSLVG
jgi:hypothetical protein